MKVNGRGERVTRKETQLPKSSKMASGTARVRSNRERKRNAVLRAAVTAFNKQGFHQTSLDEIGGTLGLTKAALYYYFPTKSVLLAACFERAMSLTFECFERARREGRNGREKLILYFQLYIDLANSELDEYFLLTEDFALDPDDRKRLVRQRDTIERELRKLVREGIEDGSIVGCDPKLAVFLLLGAVNWIPKWFSPRGSWSYRQLSHGVAEMLDRMLSTTPRHSLTEDLASIEIEVVDDQSDPLLNGKSKVSSDKSRKKLLKSAT
jgi:TetR/AcrR family transcriptional regulator